jgi:hypothetical protein
MTKEIVIVTLAIDPKTASPIPDPIPSLCVGGLDQPTATRPAKA